MQKLSGKTVLVTGASAGIGQATASALISAGARVICSARRLARLNSLVSNLGANAIALELDVCDAASVNSLHSRLPNQWREIDILINNAGHDAGGRRPFHLGSIDEWSAIIETNVMGLVRVTRKVIENMVSRNCGHIVNIGSIAGIQPYATGTIYSGSKHAVHGFSESLRLDYAGTGIRVTEILPGMVRTDFAMTRWNDDVKAAAFYDKTEQCLTPEDIAQTVVFALEQPPHVVLSQMVVLPSSG